VTGSDEDTQERIANADTDVRVFYTTDFDKDGSDQTNSDGIETFEFEIGPRSNPGTFEVTVKVDAAGYATDTDHQTCIKVIVVMQLRDQSKNCNINNLNPTPGCQT
jgi:hypothetical protein